MSTYTWTYEDAEGSALSPPQAPTQGFPTQADAESWVGESWGELLESGVEAVRLHEDGTELYGPMSLRPAE